MAEPSNPFQDALNEQIRQFELKQRPANKRATTAVGLIKETAGDYPRASLTAGVGTYAAYKGVKGWKAAYKEGLDVMRSRAASEGKAVADLAGKGVQAIPRFEGGNQAIHTAAKEYAMEKIFAGFPFRNQEAINRVADLRTPRVIATGETIPVTTYEGTRANLFKEGKLIKTNTPSSVGQAVAPRQMTVEAAGKIPKLVPSREVINMASPETVSGALYESGQVTGPRRVAAAPAYTPPTARKPSLPRRVAEISTGGKFGRGNVGLETAAALFDMAREEGPVRTAYRSAAKQGEVAEGVVLGGLAAASRAGRGAANILTLGAPEYLGIYDTMDLLQTDQEAKRRYMQLRGTKGFPAENLPVIKKGKEYVPTPDSPYLKMLEAQIAAEKGIESSLMTENYYKGPEFNYVVQNGKVVAMLKPEYAAMRDAEVDRALDRYTYNRPVLNIDPTLGNIGYQFNAPRAFNFGEYTDYMMDR
jgi:hypothetical protein